VKRSALTGAPQSKNYVHFYSKENSTTNTQENNPLPTNYHQGNIINPLMDMATKYNKAAGKAFEKGDDTLANALREEAIKLTTLVANIKTELPPAPQEGVR